MWLIKLVLVNESQNVTHNALMRDLSDILIHCWMDIFRS